VVHKNKPPAKPGVFDLLGMPVKKTDTAGVLILFGARVADMNC
jgi:hypothetical protein